MKKKTIFIILVAIIACAVVAWLLISNSNKEEETETETDSVSVPQFNASNAYTSIVKQCSFGARVPNTEAHDKCGEYIIAQLKACGLFVKEQRTTVNAFDGTPLKCLNIYATTDTSATQRILISAHWDSRPWADHDPDENHHTPVMAANDGASGVAVIIELARIIMRQKPGVAVDFVCLDAEDYGVPEWKKGVDEQKDSESWCLGTQYFAANLPMPNDLTRFAINLDMVGGKGAHFYEEGFSKRYAAPIVDKVWNAAEQAGYGSIFIKQDGGFVTDDHIPLNEIAGIPTIDVIPYYPDLTDGSFGPTWHTVSDTPENIDRNILLAVGQTMLQVIYNEK